MNKKYKMYTNGIITKRVYEGEEPPEGWINSNSNKGKHPWNYKLTAEEDERVKLNREHTRQTRLERDNYNAWNAGLTQETDERVAKNTLATQNAVFEKHGVENISQWLAKQPGYSVWNAGLTQYTDERVAYQAQKIRETFENGRVIWNFGLTKETNSSLKRVSELWLSGQPVIKRTETQRKNGTLGINKLTKPELELKDKLEKIFGEDDIKTQYSSKEYPYKADFYIVSIDTYVELNANPRHGNHLFDESNSDDLTLLEELETKANEGDSWSKQILVQWHDLDIRKMQCALENDLNYVVIYANDEDIVYTHWKQCEDISPGIE